MSAEEYGAFEAPARDEAVRQDPTRVDAIEASKTKRAIHFVLDGYVAGLLQTGVLALLIFFFPWVGFDDASIDAAAESDALPASFWLAMSLNLGVSFAVYFLYSAGLEAATGRTLAKFLSRTKVVKLDGSPIGLKQACLRSVIRFVPLEFVSFLFPGPGWHDRWSKTRVVRLPRRGQVD